MSTSFLRGETIRKNGGFAQGKHTAGFSELLQRLPGERKALAADLGLPYGTYDNYVHGPQPFPPDPISRLYAITGERVILDFFLEPLDLVAVSKTKPSDIQKTDAPDVYRYLMDAVERLGTVTHEVRRAKEDGKILPSEFSRITFFIRDLERLCAEVRETLKAEVTPE